MPIKGIVVCTCGQAEASLGILIAGQVLKPSLKFAANSEPQGPDKKRLLNPKPDLNSEPSTLASIQGQRHYGNGGDPQRLGLMDGRKKDGPDPKVACRPALRR